MKLASALRRAAIVVVLVAACDPVTPPPDPTSGENPCNLIDCPPERPVCVARGTEGVCVASPGPTSCAVVLCPVGTRCIEQNGQATCVSDPCAGVVCPPGQQCTAPADAPMCVAVEQPCVCTREYAPVCGTDGRTYGNACMARCAGVAIAYPGECRPRRR